MELCKNIFFNTDKLTPNAEIRISYTGKLFENSDEVYLHYGFGNNWENVSEIKMTKSELGFQADLTLLDYESFCFCFRNSNYEWDNNDGQNYIFPIEHIETDLVVVEDTLSLMPTRKLRKSYIISKKIKILIYKVIRAVPKLVSGTYRKKAEENKQ